MTDTPPPAPPEIRWIEPTIKFILSMVIVTANVSIMVLAVMGLIPDNVKLELLLLVVNAAGNAQGVVLQYYFGSSSSSASKDRIITELRGK